MQADRPIPKLSPREQQLLRYAAEGLTDLAIAQRLGISEATVGTYWGRVRIKFGPFSRTELVATMMRSESEAAVEVLKAENEHYLKDLQIELNSGSLLSAKNLLDLAPDAMMLITENGIIEYSNQAACELFGFEAGELHGLDHEVIVPMRYKNKHAVHVEDYIQNPSRRPMGGHLRTAALRKDSTEFLIRASLTAINAESGTVVMCLIRAV
jgi:PAS domain S-box-containing protein